VSFDAAAGARVEVASCGASGRVYKGAESGGGGIARANRARLLRSARVRLGLEVGDGSDHWAPPGSDTESGAALSAAEARREEARGCWACAAWAAQRERGKGDRQAARGGGERGMGRAQDREG